MIEKSGRGGKEKQGVGRIWKGTYGEIEGMNELV